MIHHQDAVGRGVEGRAEDRDHALALSCRAFALHGRRHLVRCEGKDLEVAVTIAGGSGTSLDDEGADRPFSPSERDSEPALGRSGVGHQGAAGRQDLCRAFRPVLGARIRVPGKVGEAEGSRGLVLDHHMEAPGAQKLAEGGMDGRVEIVHIQGAASARGDAIERRRHGKGALPRRLGEGLLRPETRRARARPSIATRGRATGLRARVCSSLAHLVPRAGRRPLECLTLRLPALSGQGYDPVEGGQQVPCARASPSCPAC